MAAAMKATPNPQMAAASQGARSQALTEKRKQAAAEAARRQTIIRIRNIGIVAVLVVGLAIGLFWLLTSQAQTQQLRDTAGELVPQQSSPHLKTMDDPHAAYTTDPPTSGPHVPEVPRWGV